MESYKWVVSNNQKNKVFKKFVTFQVTSYLYVLILNIKHKGLRAYYQKGDSSKLQPAHIGKIRLILTRLDAALSTEDMNVPGYNLHQLAGDLYPFWSVKVDKNYRIIFRFEKDNVLDVDYLDYH